MCLLSGAEERHDASGKYLIYLPETRLEWFQKDTCCRYNTCYYVNIKVYSCASLHMSLEIGTQVFVHISCHIDSIHSTNLISTCVSPALTLYRAAWFFGGKLFNMLYTLLKGLFWLRLNYQNDATWGPIFINWSETRLIIRQRVQSSN